METKKFCCYCSNPLESGLVDGIIRKKCTGCGAVIYENPVPAACVVLVDEHDRVLLGKRSVEPKIGLWCLPGGFIELGETPEKAALRELKEETGIEGKIEMLLGVTTDPHPDYGTVLITAYLVKTFIGNPVAGDDVSEIGFFNDAGLPDIAFDSHKAFIRQYLSGHSRGVCS